MGRKFTLRERVRSFGYAVAGISLMLRTQHNAWIHAVATFTVLLLAWFLRIEIAGWRWIVLAIVSVWTAEAMNTAIELLADFASPCFHPEIKKVKDVAAGAVLLTATGAAIIGLLVLGPPMVSWFGFR